MAFPAVTPTQRSYEPGDWAAQSFNALSGREYRIRYGDQRTKAKLQLRYDNVTDAVADEFLAHYLSTTGTFETFTLSIEARSGWTGGSDMFGPGGTDAAYRYESPPQITSVRPGISSVTVSLVGVL